MSLDISQLPESRAPVHGVGSDRLGRDSAELGEPAAEIDPTRLAAAGVSLVFFMLIYRDAARGLATIERVRRFFPRARLVVRADGAGGEWRAAFESLGAEFYDEPRLFPTANGARVVHRMLELFAAEPADYLFKIDADTGVWRPLAWLPAGECHFGTLQGDRGRRSIQGGCMGFTRATALRIMESRLLLDAGFALATGQLLGQAKNPYLGALRARHRKVGLTSFDWSVAAVCRRLGIEIRGYAEVRCDHQEPAAEDGRYAMTHPASASPGSAGSGGRGTRFLVDPSAWAAVFEPLRGKRIGYVQGRFGNAGDALIHYGTLRLLAWYGVNFTILNPKPWRAESPLPVRKDVDEVLLFGGGNMGAPGSGRLRAGVRSWPVPMTLLPQSWRAPEDAPYARVFARERVSLRLCPGAEWAPDLGLAYEAHPAGHPVEDCGLFLRKDEEALFAQVPSRGDPPAGLGRLDAAAYVARAARFRRIVTDRLHFAIAGLHLGREVVLLPNGYHKNRAVFECSLSALGCGWADSPKEAGLGQTARVISPPRVATVEAVVLNWKRPANVARIIAALRGQSVPCRITICDAAPEGDECELPTPVRRSADTFYRFTRNWGSLNRFIPSFGYMEEFLFYLDDDLLPGPRALEWLLECARREPQFAVLGEKGRNVQPDGAYCRREVPRLAAEPRRVDFVVRAGLVRTEHLACLDWFRRKMDLRPGEEPDLLREDDLLLCTAIQTQRQLPCLLTPIGDRPAETSLFHTELPAPHPMSGRRDHFENRTRFLRAARLAGWRSLLAKDGG